MDLFEHLPEKIFRPLANKTARFNAALLLHLHDHVFSTIGETPARHVVLAEIADFMNRYEGSDLGELEDVEIDPSTERSFRREARGQAIRHYYRFYDLVQSGWFVELRDRYRKLVDLSPEGRLLLREFKRIATGDRRSYGGEVLKVLGQLNTAIDDPDGKSECISTAWSFAQDFAHHLRSMAATMRRLEEEILSQRELRRIFRSFFDEFVSQYLIADYKTLYTTNNPFRFHHEVIEKTQAIMGNSLLLSRLSQAYVSEGRAEDLQQAENIVLREVDEVYRIFDTIQQHLDIIQQTQFRIERRIHTIIRYMDRFESGSIERVTRAMRALGATSLDMSAEVPLEPMMLLSTPLLGGDVLAVPPQPRAPVERTRYRQPERDPAQDAYTRDKRLYLKRIALSSAQIQEFLDRHLAGRQVIRGGEIPIETVDDFIVFQRLRELPFLFSGMFSKDYGLRLLDEQAENEWLVFTDFELFRKNKDVAA